MFLAVNLFQFLVIKTIDPDLNLVPDWYIFSHSAGSGFGLNESGSETQSTLRKFQNIFSLFFLVYQ
jgi:hypothetical protein